MLPPAWESPYPGGFRITVFFSKKYAFSPMDFGKRNSYFMRSAKLNSGR
jgi:hypothetical protein